MRIGFFTDGFLPQPNGVATSVFETARELEARGHEVFIIAPKYPGYVDRKLNVIRIPSLKIAEKPETRIGISLPDRHLRRILDIDFDIIHGHSGGPITLLGWEISRAKKIPCVVTYHTLWNRYTHYFLKGKVVTPKMMEQATKIFGNQVDFLIAPTDKVEKELRAYGVKKPIKVVPSGININKFNVSSTNFLRTRLKLEENTPILLFVGRLNREKSVDFLIKTTRKIIDKNSKTHLVIIGTGSEKKRLQILAKRLGIDKNTHFLGDIKNEDMPKVYSGATVFIFSSTTETQGLVVPEALASGVPVVAVDDPAYDIIENGKNGFLVKNDEREFAAKVLSIIQDGNLRSRLSDYAVKSAKKLSVTSTADSLEAIYFDLLDKHNRESVGRIMSETARTEGILIANVAFWIAVLILRLTTFAWHKTIFYPSLVIFNQVFYHYALGIVLLLFSLALFVKNKKTNLISLLIFGIGAAFVSDDLVSGLLRHATIFDYWSSLNLAGILIVGIVPVFFTKNKKEERPKFYISTRIVKHVNPQNPHVTVVVPAYNEGEFIEPTLKSLLNQSYKNFELIVVDNNSDDKTGEVAARFGARVIVEKTRGVAAARQAGFLAAKGEIIVSTDADSLVPDHWIQKIVQKYDDNRNLAGFGGLANLYSGPVMARAAGRFFFPIFWKIDKIVSGGWNMSGFNMSVRKSSFKKTGGFDTSLKMGEDIDLSEKLRRVGDVEIDQGLMVYASGRRYAQGLIPGLMVYAPWWISKMILKRDKPFEFPTVRSEKIKSSSLDLLPLSICILLLSVLFYATNSTY